MEKENATTISIDQWNLKLQVISFFARQPGIIRYNVHLQPQQTTYILFEDFGYLGHFAEVVRTLDGLPWGKWGADTLPFEIGPHALATITRFVGCNIPPFNIPQALSVSCGPMTVTLPKDWTAKFLADYEFLLANEALIAKQCGEQIKTYAPHDWARLPVSRMQTRSVGITDELEQRKYFTPVDQSIQQ